MTAHNTNNPSVLTGALLVTATVAIFFAAAYYGVFYGKDGKPLTDDSATASEVVVEFGTHMKNVSLLAPADTVAAAMDKEYAPYVLPDTLAAWKKDPTNAPGRLTSSPWPDHIQVATSTPEGDQYRVEGFVVELTSDTATKGGQGSGYAAVFTLARSNGVWKIASFSREAAVSAPITTSSMTGTYVCLPHADQTGPQTMECAFGLQTDEGIYYALDFTNFASDRGLTLATGERIKVEGAINSLHSLPVDDHLRIYAIDGVIHVTAVTEVK